jgi:1-aminocyclopropane-1-carboxylate deaminase/D-cysteine desulfhydrase-like pyridoxal-dependent ACC family enzyme
MEIERLELVDAPTPLQPADRLGVAIGLAPGALVVKREDLIGVGAGGNKIRKLEYLGAQAIAGGYDTLVTGGGPQSNHVRATAAVAARLGLGCVAVLGGERPEQLGGNLLLDRLFGAELVWAGPLAYYDLEQAIVDQAAARGAKAFAIPLGGASTIGTLGYVRVARELLAQDASFDVVVTAAGTGGTHAGLAAGLGDLDRVLGVDAGTRPDLDDWVPVAAGAAAELVGLARPSGRCVVDHARFGSAYGAPTDECRRALQLAARTEGLILDPVYSGKALVGLMAAVREGRIAPSSRVVFLASGGMPALFTAPYDRWVVD